MAVRDEIDIKYWFPKLNFNVRPSNNQKYVVKYTLYSENYENGNWITLNSACEINPEVLDLLLNMLLDLLILVVIIMILNLKLAKMLQ